MRWGKSALVVVACSLAGLAEAKANSRGTEPRPLEVLDDLAPPGADGPEQMRLGDACLEAGDYGCAADHYRQAHELDPGWPEPVYGLGEAYRGLADGPEAARWYQRYTAMAGADPARATKAAAWADRLDPAPSRWSRSPSTALAWSLGATVGLVLTGILLPPLLLVGVVIGPNLGHFYAGDLTRAFIGIGIRTATALAWFVSAFATFTCFNCSSGTLSLLITGVVILGLALLAESLWDIIDAPAAVRRRQRAEIETLALEPVRGPPAPAAVGLAWRF